MLQTTPRATKLRQKSYAEVETGEKTNFLQQNCSCSDLELLATQNPGCTRVYINSSRCGNRYKLSLSKGSGDILYIVSNQNHEDMRLYFPSYENTAMDGKPGEKSTTPIEHSVKRVKQQNLLSFFNRK